MRRQAEILEWDLHCTVKKWSSIKINKAMSEQAERSRHGIAENDPEEVATARKKMWTGSFWSFLDSEYSKGAPRYDARSRKVKELMDKEAAQSR